MDKVHTSSSRGDYETPKELIDNLSTVFPWDLDACASRPNVCDRFYSPEDNGLVQPWHGLVWLNPPYGRNRHIDRWTLKARLEAKQPGCTVVCLLPARTSTQWWHDNVPRATWVLFIKGRLRFDLPGGEPAPNSAGFPSALVIFGEINDKQVCKLMELGWLVGSPGK